MVANTHEGQAAAKHPTAAGLLWAADDGGMSAFSATGTTSCGGVPKVCVPIWHTGAATNPQLLASGVVAAESTAPPGTMVAYAPEP